MIKIKIDNDYIKNALNEYNNTYSSFQMAIAVLGTILIAFVISLKAYTNLATLIISAILLIIFIILYLLLEFKRNDLVEKWEVKEAKVIIDKKNNDFKETYKVNIKDYKNKVKILYEDYKDLENNEKGYAIITKRKHPKVLLWYPKDKYEYKK